MKPLKERLADVFGFTGGEWKEDGGTSIYNHLRRIAAVWGDSDRTICTHSPAMLEMLWDDTIFSEKVFAKYTYDPDIALDAAESWKIGHDFFLSLYSEIHGEEITWEELKRKVEG